MVDRNPNCLGEEGISVGSVLFSLLKEPCSSPTVTRLKGNTQVDIYKVVRYPVGWIINVLPVFPVCNQGLVVQSIVSLTSSLRGQLVKSFTTL